MKYSRILAASKSDQIDALIEGLPVNSNGFFVSEEQMDNLEASLEAHETAAANHATQLGEQALQAQQATEELATANETIAARDARIAELEAENTSLKGKPAADFSNTHKTEDTPPVDPAATAKAKYFTSVDAHAAQYR